MPTEPHGDWKKAFKMGKRCTKRGEWKAASFYYANALSTAPGNMELIEEYVSIQLKVATNPNNDRQLTEQLDWLELFIQEQIPFVKADEIEALLHMDGQLQMLREKQQAATPHGQPELELQWTRLKNGQLPQSIPSSPQQQGEALQHLEELHAYALSHPLHSSDAANIQRLEHTYLAPMRIALQYTGFLDEAEALLATAAKLSSPMEKAYCLQLAETPIRQLVVLMDKLEQRQQSKVRELLGTLERESASASDASQREESALVWALFEEKQSAPLQTIRCWTAPNKTFPTGECELQLKRIQSAGKALNQLLGKLTHEEYLNKALYHQQELSKLAAQANQAQQQQYNQWAMSRIQRGFSKGCEQIGTLYDDKEKLGEEIVTWLGIVDTRYLTTEAQRCYTEVFEHLFSSLKGPKDKDDFTTKGRKLKVIKDMFGATKQELSAF